MAPTVGWGDSPYGGGPWGGGPGEGGVLILTAEAVAENRVRFETSAPLIFSGVGDAFDASRPEVWSLSATDDARAVKVILAQNPPVYEVDDPSRHVDLILDRGMSPYPAQYLFQGGVNAPLPSQDFSEVLENVSGLIYGLRVPRVVDPSEEATTAGRDLAMVPGTSSGLGAYATDDTGDYAFDRGRTGLKKRVFRRLFTKKGSFLWLPNYGASILQLAGKLATAGTLASLEEDCKAQLMAEPDIQSADVAILPLNPTKGLFKLTVSVMPKAGQGVRFFAEFLSRA